MAVSKISKTFIDSITFNDETTTYTSDSFNSTDYEEMAIHLSKTVSGTPTDIKIQVEVSPDASNWYELENDFWGDFRYEDTAGDQNESVYSTCPFQHIRIKATATGTDASNTFTITASMTFTSKS